MSRLDKLNVRGDAARQIHGGDDAEGAPAERLRIVNAEDLDWDLSYKYNSRFATTRGRAYKSMLETLRTEPDAFCGQNSGIVIANSEFILDGGTTYKALRDFRASGGDLSQVRVKVFYKDGMTEEEMVKDSKGLNTKVTPPLTGERDLLGDWDDIKARLDPKYADMFEFRPGTNPKARFRVEFLVAILHGLWPGKSRTNRVDRVYSSKGKLVEQFTRDKYRAAYDRLNEGIELWSLVAEKIASLSDKEINRVGGIRKPGRMILPNGKEVEARIPEPYIWPIFCAFGKLLDDKAEWAKPPEAMLDKSFKKMWNQLVADWREAGKNPTQLGKTPSAYLNQVVALLQA